MDLQPTLVGERVTLRPIQLSDWDALYAAGSDPLIWAAHPASNRWQEARFREYFDGALASGSAFVILDNATGAVIGSSRYDLHDPVRDEIEIGWTFLARAYWGGAYNREVKRLMVDHIHRFVRTVYFMVGEQNVRSRRAVEKIGGVLRPELVDRVYGRHTIRHVVYDLHRPEGAESAIPA